MPTQAATSTKRARTCIACGATQGKETLLRIVRTADGVRYDKTGKMPGRGAYVCGVACLEAAQAKNGLDRALRTKVNKDDYERIAHEMCGADFNELGRRGVVDGRYACT